MSELQMVRLAREALHRRVWEEPMHWLAAEFRISDVALAKICRKAQIPVPGRGYWAMKAAGQGRPRADAAYAE